MPSSMPMANWEGLRLAPFYDLMSTRVYSGLGPNFAFHIGGESEPGSVGPAQIMAFAASLNVAPKYVERIARDMANQIESAIPVAVKDLLPILGPSEKVMAQRLEQKIGSLVRKTRDRMLGGGTGKDQPKANQDNGLPPSDGHRPT